MSRELDVLVATRVMGYTGDKANATHLFPTKFEAASEVLERMHDLGYDWTINQWDHTNITGLEPVKRAQAIFFRKHEVVGDVLADSIPMAVCLAALKAVEQI